MRYLPIAIDLQGRDALVLGATGEAARKILRLHAAGARVTVLAGPDGVDAEIARGAEAGAFTLATRSLEEADLERAWIVFANRGDAALDARLGAWAEASKRLVCVLDLPAASTFANPAVVDVSGITMAFSSGGGSPGLLRRIREDLETLFGDDRFRRFVDALRTLRNSLPAGARSARMTRVIEGFGIEARLVFPPWFEADSPPPP